MMITTPLLPPQEQLRKNACAARSGAASHPPCPTEPVHCSADFSALTRWCAPTLALVQANQSGQLQEPPDCAVIGGGGPLSVTIDHLFQRHWSSVMKFRVGQERP